MKLNYAPPPIPLMRNNKLPNTWKRLVKFLKFRLQKPLFIRAFIQSRGSKYEPPASRSWTPRRRRRRRRKRGVVRLISKLQCFKSSTKDKDNVMNLKSFSDGGGGGGGGGSYSIKEPFPSPLTPAYVRLLSAAAANKNSDEEEILSCGDQKEQEDQLQEEDMKKMMMEEDAIKSFEKYMFEMVVEDGTLTNLEELLYYLNTLKCPVFVALVSRFYAELCMDLFSIANNNQLRL